MFIAQFIGRRNGLQKITIGGVLPRVYIFMEKIIKDDYIKNYKPGTCMVMQKKTHMKFYLLKELMSFFKRLVLGGIF
jgi:hypothetical protein